MNIIINGQSRITKDNTSAESLIQSICSNPQVVICELNGTILDRGQWASTCLNPNDRIELVTLVGGG
ncbi:MAG: sulfur carrier protein ThiS [Candidatus Omnitrophota bacterium]